MAFRIKLTKRRRDSYLDAAMTERGTTPEFIYSDNSPEFIGADVRAYIFELRLTTLTIAPANPWEDPSSENVRSQLRDEFHNRKSFGFLLEAKVPGEKSLHDYNHHRQNSSLGHHHLAAFAQRSPRPPLPLIHNLKINKVSQSECLKLRGQSKKNIDRATSTTIRTQLWSA